MPAKRVGFMVGIFIVITVVICIFAPALFKLRRLSIKKNNLIKQIRATQASNLYLQAEKRRLEEDLIYIEKMSRQKLRLSNPGEVVYRIIPPQQAE